MSIQRPDMDTEILRYLRESDLRITLLRDTDHVIVKLPGKRPWHDDILPGQPSGLANSAVTYPCSSPVIGGGFHVMRLSVPTPQHVHIDPARLAVPPRGAGLHRPKAVGAVRGI